jgi:hypothetical protein
VKLQPKQKANGAIATVDVSLFEESAGDGLQNISQEDTALPFLKILSQLSPELESVEDARAGMLYNTVSGQLYKSGVHVVPCHYEKKYIEWAPRGTGNGSPVNQYSASSNILAKTSKKAGDWRDYLPNGNYIEACAQHYVMLVEERQPALIVMKSTQLKKSRKWNSMIMTTSIPNSKGVMFQPPSYSHVYSLATEKESNDKGQWYGWEIGKVGLIEDQSLFILCKNFAESISKGEVEVKHTEDNPVKTSDIPF